MKLQHSWTRPQAVLCAAALALGLAGVGFASAEHLGILHSALQLKLANPDEGPSRTGFAPVVRKVLPAVVNISSSKVSKIPTGFEGQLPDDPIFRQFFGNGRQFGNPRQAPTQREQSLGSGIVMSPNGYILTNNHVVDGATEVRVTLSDKRDFKAKVVGTDPKSDIAVLKIDAADLPTIVVGDSTKVQVGDYALAVGDPFGVGTSVTMGIVSATGRTHLGIEDYEDFIQTDAPINPGNSGGALVNDRGELIGVNTAILAHGSEGNQGIGFAIPVNMARGVMEQIVDHGKVTRGFLGIVPQDVTPAMAKAFRNSTTSGALVGDVSADSPAQRGGLMRGDIVTSVNGKPVADANDLRMRISTLAPGTDVRLGILRDGAAHEVTVHLGELPTEEAAVTHDGNNSGRSGSSALSGVSVDNLDADTAHDLGLSPTTKGVVVTKVDPSSAAAEAGLHRGDVIQEVNHQPVRDTAAFERAMRSSNGQSLLLVNRNGNTMFVAV
jgi:serine protease Do